LENPGGCDITADVDFSRLITKWRELGGNLASMEDQHHFLMHAAEPWLRSLEGNALGFRNPLLRQFQTLVHPSLMGRHFRMLHLLPPD
jgi:SAM-dependent MidA family methyltransferase